MNVSELFIENKRADLSSELSALISYAIDDIKDFAARNTAVSKTIVLPGTQRNNNLFGQIFDVKISNPFNDAEDNVSTNFNAAVAAECRVFQNKIQVFKGVIRLLEIVIVDGIPEYEVAVFGELGGFISAVGSGKLQDLDFSAYDQPWAVSGVTASWDMLNGSGVCFPLIDYGGVSQLKVDYDLRAMRPAFYVKEYIDKIFQRAGYTYECDLFNTSRFKKLIIPNSQKNLQKRSTELVDASASIQVASPPVGYTMLFDSISGTGFSYSSGVFTYQGTTSTIVTIAYLLGAVYTGPGGGNTFLNILQNGVVVHSRSSSSVNTTFSGSFAIPMATNDTLEFQWTFTGSFLPGGQVLGSFSADAADAVVIDMVPGDFIDMNSTIPQNILQKDFISSLLRLFNLYVYEDRYTKKKLLIKPYVDFYDLNPSGVVDWTYKMDRGKAIRLKPMSELNARYYSFKFKDDNDYYNELYRKTYNESYGDYLYDSAFEFVEDKQEIKTIFSPSVLVGYDGADKIVCAFYKKNAGVEERFDTNIRILQTKKITGVTSWAIKDGVSTLQSGLTTYGYAGHYDDPDAPANDIHFGVPRQLYFILVSGGVNVTQFNVYWSPYMAEITDKDSRMKSGHFKLSEQDIHDLDFGKLIFIDGTLWRLNKIVDYNANNPDVCKCELLKVINLTY